MSMMAWLFVMGCQTGISTTEFLCLTGNRVWLTSQTWCWYMSFFASSSISPYLFLYIYILFLFFVGQIVYSSASLTSCPGPMLSNEHSSDEPLFVSPPGFGPNKFSRGESKALRVMNDRLIHAKKKKKKRRDRSA